jgi:hypothetical protein
VTDPGNARILVFDAGGNFLFTFGQPGVDELCVRPNRPQIMNRIQSRDPLKACTNQV